MKENRRHVRHNRKSTMIYEITLLNLENGMDLILAHKRSIKLGELLNLSISGQTTFTTAISECCREVIEKDKNGILIIRIEGQKDKFHLTATVRYKDPGNNETAYNSLNYARKLVHQLSIY